MISHAPAEAYWCFLMFPNSSILIVEEQPMVRSLIRSNLKQMGLKKVIEALTGRDAIALIKTRTIGLIIAQWDLTDMTGPEFLDSVRNNPVSQSTPFLSMMVDTDPATVQKAIKAGIDDILGATQTDAVIFGHAGDANIHVNPLLDVRQASWRDRARTILDETADLVAGLGGTLSGEHGDGRLRAPLMERIWGPRLAGCFARTKALLDPEGILNPGVIVPLPDQDPLEGLWPQYGGSA